MITRDFFFSLNNPVIFSVILSFTVAAILFFIYVRIYLPLQQKHKEEKENLELKNFRLMAMLAELNPAPLFRFDNAGKIIFSNKSGKTILKKLNLDNPTVAEVIPAGQIPDFDKFISEAGTFQTTVQLGSEFYDVIINGIPETGFGQIYCSDITRRKNTEEELGKNRKQLRELSIHIQKVQEEEKRKISRELHDNFGQILTTIKMNIELLKEKQNDGSLNEEFISINNQLEEARKEIRELSYRLRPRVLDDFGLVPALKMLCEEVAEKSNIKGLFQSFNFTGRLSPGTETNIYRIVQEALNNVVKHSKASEFSVQLIGKEQNFVVTVEDDGIGFDQSSVKSSNKSGMGLINMSERALSFDGKFFISSVPGRGTEIIIEIPLNNGKEENKSSDS